MHAGIMTHHVGYTLLFEQALQVVNPAVSVPYWEYTIECEYLYIHKVPQRKGFSNDAGHEWRPA